ncbi:MAG: hypothetical protein E7266_01015 [Lachnospiraceae bacterium]|nr:hypothetical protein [Lachnospiraceae bacterium]
MNKKKKIIIGLIIAAACLALIAFVGIFAGGIYLFQKVNTGDSDIEYMEKLSDEELDRALEKYNGVTQKYIRENYSEEVKSIKSLALFPRKHINENKSDVFKKTGNEIIYGHDSISYVEGDMEYIDDEFGVWYINNRFIEFNGGNYWGKKTNFSIDIEQCIYEITDYEAYLLDEEINRIPEENITYEDKFSVYGINGISEEYAIVVKNQNTDMYCLYVVSDYSYYGEEKCAKDEKFTEQTESFDKFIGMIGLKDYADVSRSAIEVTMFDDKRNGGTISYYPDDILTVLDMILDGSTGVKKSTNNYEYTVDYTFQMRFFHSLLGGSYFIGFNDSGYVTIIYDDYYRNDVYIYETDEELYKKVIDYIFGNYEGEKIKNLSVSEYAAIIHEEFVYANADLYPDSFLQEYIQFNKSDLITERQNAEQEESMIDLSAHKLLRKASSTIYTVRLNKIIYNGRVYQCVGLYNDLKYIDKHLGKVEGYYPDLNVKEPACADVYAIKDISDELFVVAKYADAGSHALYAVTPEKVSDAEVNVITKLSDITNGLSVDKFNDYENYYIDLKVLYVNNSEYNGSYGYHSAFFGRSVISDNYYYTDDALTFLDKMAGGNDVNLIKVIETEDINTDATITFKFYHPALEAYIDYSYIGEGENKGKLCVSMEQSAYAYVFDTKTEDAYNVLEYIADKLLGVRVDYNYD